MSYYVGQLSGYFNLILFLKVRLTFSGFAFGRVSEHKTVNLHYT